MIKINLGDLILFNQCHFKQYLNSFNWQINDNKTRTVNKVIKNILYDNNFLDYTFNDFKDKINSELNNNLFFTKQEKCEVVKFNSIYLYRLQRYLYNKLIKLENDDSKLINHIDKNINRNITINGITFTVHADYILKSENQIEVINFKNIKPELSYNARNPENAPINSIALYSLYLLGKELYPNTNVISSIYYLKGKDDDIQLLNSYNSLSIMLFDTDIKLQSIKDKKEITKTKNIIKKISNNLWFDYSKGNNIISINEINNKVEDEIKNLYNQYTIGDKVKNTSKCDSCRYYDWCNYHKCIKEPELLPQDKKNNNKQLELTDNQKKITLVDNGYWRVNAVAGSGKSTCMIMRVINLVKNGCLPEDILMITFTKKGCEELKDKIIHWGKIYGLDIDYNKLNIYTFNSFGAIIINKEWEKLGYNKAPELATNIDVLETIRNLLNDYPQIPDLNYKDPLLDFPNAHGCIVELNNYFNKIKAFDYQVDDFIIKVLKDDISKANMDKSVMIYKLYEKFNETLKNKNLIQYLDQVLLVNELFEKYPDLINRYGFKHIIVDEYQDTNYSQVKLLQYLQSSFQFESLMVVGDDYQSIYGFTNTSPENIINFNYDFPEVKDLYLLDNFRSTPQICNLANNLIKLNTTRINKDIISRQENGKLPEVNMFSTLNEENQYIGNKIQDLINRGIKLNNICYIARKKKELVELKKVLDGMNIPNIININDKYLDDKDINIIIDLANFFLNPEKTYYLVAFYHALSLYNNENDDEIYKYDFDSIINRITSDYISCTNEQEAINLFNNMIEPLIINNSTVKSFIDNLPQFETLKDYMNYLIKLKIYNDDSYIIKDKDLKYNAVTLTTAHSSKGKEWNNVFVSLNEFNYDENTEEERRLLFVSITRAKKELYITYNLRQDKRIKKGKYNEFADDIIKSMGV